MDESSPTRPTDPAPARTDASEASSTSTLAAFLREVGRSDDAALRAFGRLVPLLRNPSTRVLARRFLGDIRRATLAALDETPEPTEPPSFAFERLVMETGTRAGRPKDDRPLELLLFPRLAPFDDASVELFDALARRPVRDFQGKTLVQEDCGCAWVALLLARKVLPARVACVDSRPAALVSAEMSWALNALDDDGDVVRDAEGRPLLPSMEFMTPDVYRARVADGSLVPQETLSMDLRIADVAELADDSDEASEGDADPRAARGPLSGSVSSPERS